MLRWSRRFSLPPNTGADSGREKSLSHDRNPKGCGTKSESRVRFCNSAATEINKRLMIENRKIGGLAPRTQNKPRSGERYVAHGVSHGSVSHHFNPAPSGATQSARCSWCSAALRLLVET